MHYDLIIVGGGLVGAGLAVALQDTGWQIALVDASLASQDDPRLFALNSGNCQFLTNLKFWPQLESYATPIHRVHVSSQGKFGAVNLDRNDLHLSSLGHVIPAKYIEAVMNERLSNSSYVTVYRPAKLETLQQENNIVRLHLQKENEKITITAPIVIGADGTHSTVRAQLNIPVDHFDYQQSAIVTITKLNRAHHFTAYERFNSQGAIAMLPLTDNQCATIWSADNEAISALMALTDEAFLQKLQQNFGYRLGRLQAIHQRHCFPLQMQRAKTMVSGNVFLVGNAAHTLHPIAAQGFNLALYEVAMLVEAILKKKVFSAIDLQEINEKIQKQQAVSIGMSHRLSQVFSSASPLTQFALQAGMLGLDLASPLKKRLLNRIMGRSGSVPHLLLGAMEYEKIIS